MVTVWSPVRDTETERMKDEERAWPFHRNGFQQDCEVCAELGHLFSGVRLWGAASQPARWWHCFNLNNGISLFAEAYVRTPRMGKESKEGLLTFTESSKLLGKNLRKPTSFLQRTEQKEYCITALINKNVCSFHQNEVSSRWNWINL